MRQKALRVIVIALAVVAAVVLGLEIAWALRSEHKHCPHGMSPTQTICVPSRGAR